MSEGYEPIVGAEGELLGYAFQAEDGAVYAADLGGQVFAVEDQGEVYEVEPGAAYVDDDEFPIAGGEPEEADPYSAFDERLDALEQRAAEPPEPPPAYFAEDQVDYTNALLRDRADLEAVEGRPLLLDERRRIAERVAQQVEAGEAPDAFAAAADLHDLGQPLLDLDDQRGRGQRHQARAEFMLQRLQDQERYAAAERGEDDLTASTPPPSRAEYDLDSRAERLAYYSDRLRGSGAEPGDTFSSSDDQEDE